MIARTRAKMRVGKGMTIHFREKEGKKRGVFRSESTLYLLFLLEQIKVVVNTRLEPKRAEEFPFPYHLMM